MELDLSSKKKMDFNEFKRIDGILPTIMHPAFRIQHAMRVKVCCVGNAKNMMSVSDDGRRLVAEKTPKISWCATEAQEH